MKTESIIYVDHSILATGVCEEKQRLSYVEDYVPLTEAPPLVFGSAFHAGVAALYMGSSLGQSFEARVEQAKLEFLREVQKKGPGSLPIAADGGQRRSQERGIYLLEAYAEKWKNQDGLWQDVCYTDAKSGEVKPYVEVGFAVYFMDWKGVPVVCVGKIDRLRRYRIDGKIYVWETKTTSRGLSFYVDQVRPNHQLTTYKWAANETIGLDVTGIILDCIFISDRKIDGKYPNGIDMEKDFRRVETRRSPTDVEEFLYDLRRATTKFLELRDSGVRRGRREAPTICYMYGGCHFLDACNSNLNPQIMKNNYRKRKWEPWKGILEDTTLQVVNRIGG